MPGEPKIKIVLERSYRQNKFKEELYNVILAGCEKYKLSYFDVFGILQSLMFMFNCDAESLEEEGV